ncbi:MAG: hypothetical protein ACTSVI_02450 [Promethearchaeota archaeon]
MNVNNIDDLEIGHQADSELLEEKYSEADFDEEKTPRLFPIRLGFFSFLFIAFFLIAVLILNVISFFYPDNKDDIFQLLLDIIRKPIQWEIIRQIYDFLVPVSGVEALFISASFVLTFITISIACMKKRIKALLFRGRIIKKALMQVLIFFGIFIMYMQFLKLISVLFPAMGKEGIAIHVLIGGATMWIFFQSFALFTATRKTGTTIENNLLKKSNKKSHLIARLFPFLATLYILAISIGYFYFLNFMKDIFHIYDPAWKTTIEIFLILFLAITILPSFLVAGSKNKKQKQFDNLVVLVSVITMVPYILFNFTLYFYMPKSKTGEGIDITGISQIILWIELSFTLVLLILSLRSVAKRSNYKVGRLEKESFILFIYASLSGQFGIRYLQSRNLLPEYAGINKWLLDGQYILVNLFVLVAIVISILAFSSDRFGIFFRVHERVSRQDRKRMDFIYQHLRMEYNKIGEAFPIVSVYEDLSTIMNVNKLEIIDLVEKTNRTYTDLRFDGIKTRKVHFLQ